MKYYVLKLLTTDSGADGSKIEGVFDNEDSARTQYHSVCAALHNDKETLFRAVVSILNYNGDSIIKEIIDHLPAPEPQEEVEE